jgi:ABC-2 type transport system ATP-binding protein
MKNVLEVQGLIKKFQRNTVLHNISFSIKKGELFGLLGPNGAGKTTTIRILTGLLTPDSGGAFIAGMDVQKNPLQAKMKLGILPEMGNIYMDLSARENIILAGRFYGYSKKWLNKEAEKLMEQFELSERMDEPVRKFSKGMKQRVNIACALVHNPEILFLDKPTSGLDVKSQRLIKRIIKERNNSGITVFLTTHNIEEAHQLCSRVCIINKGEIVKIGTPGELIQTWQGAQSIDVSFAKEILNLDELKNNSIHRIEKRPEKWKLYTCNPDEAIKHVVQLAEKQNFTIKQLEICKASLEDVFITLTEKGNLYESKSQF